jgi:hypothetical protein
VFVLATGAETYPTLTTEPTSLPTPSRNFAPAAAHAILRSLQKRPRDQEPVRSIARRVAERDTQGMLLGLRKRAEPIEHRRAELMQPGEQQLRL